MVYWERTSQTYVKQSLSVHIVYRSFSLLVTQCLSTLRCDWNWLYSIPHTRNPTWL